MEGNHIDVKGAEYISEMLRENVYVTTLSLRENRLGREGLTSLLEAIGTNSSISDLDLSGTGIGDEEAPCVAEMINENYMLKTLRLSHNRLLEKGGKALKRSIANNENLLVLDLSWNHLRREGAVSIAEAVQINNTLLALNVSWNGFYLEGCKAIAKALDKNKTLERLDLSCNRINESCLAPLLRTLRKNKSGSLRILRLGENPLTTEAAVTVLKALQENSKHGIIELDLKGQWVDGTFLRMLDALQAIRPITVHYGQVKRDDVMCTDGSHDELVNEDPMMVIMEFMRLQNLRLMDLFTALDKDGSKSLTYAEFRNGLMAANIPLSAKSLDALINKLDKDGDGEVDYGELLEGQKQHKRRLLRLKAHESKDTPAEDTELGRISAKIKALLAARLMQKTKPDPEKKLQQTILQLQSVVNKKEKPALAISDQDNHDIKQARS